MVTEKSNELTVNAEFVESQLSEFSLFSTRFSKTFFLIAKWGLFFLAISAAIVSGSSYYEQAEYFFEDYYLEALGEVILSVDSCANQDFSEDYQYLSCFISEGKNLLREGFVQEDKISALQSVIIYLDEHREDGLEFNLSEMSNYYVMYPNLYRLLPRNLQNDFPRNEILIFSKYFIPAAFLLYSTGFLIVALMIFTYDKLAGKVPEAMSRMWRRHIIQFEANDGDNEQKNNELVKFSSFIEKYQVAMEHPIQVVFSIVFGGLMLWRVFATQDIFGTGGIFSAPTKFIILEIVSQPIIGIVTGVLLWRIFVLSFLFLNLGRKFSLTPQIEHSDQVGGMAIVGNLFLWSALVYAWPAIFLSVWYIIIRNFDMEPLAKLGGSMESLNHIRDMVFIFFFAAIILLVLASIISFVMPVFSIHREMLKYRDNINIRLDQLSVQIDSMQRELLENAGEMEIDQANEMEKQIELMLNVHAKYRKIPTWPYDTQTILKFIGAQAGPVLTLVGFSESIIEFVKSLFGSLP